MSKSPPTQLPGDTKTSSNLPKIADFKAVVRTPSPTESNAVDDQHGDVKRGIKRALPLTATVDQAVFLEMDEDYLLTPPRADMDKGLDDVNVLSIPSSRASLIMSHLPSQRESEATSNFDSGDEIDDEIEEEGKMGKKVKRRLKNIIEKELANKSEGNPDLKKECALGGNLDGSASEVEVPSMPGSYTLTPHSSFIGPIHTISLSISSPEASHDLSPTQHIGSNPSLLFGFENSSIPLASGVAAYGTFPLPIEGRPLPKSNLTQAILDLQRAAAMTPRIANSRGDIIGHRGKMMTERRIMPKILVIEDGKSGFLPTEATVTTAVGCPGVRSEMSNPKLEAVKLMYRLLWPKEDDHEMYVYTTASEGPATPIDPDPSLLLRCYEAPSLEGCEFIDFRKRRGCIRPRTISHELHRPCRDDVNHSILRVRNLKHKLLFIRSGNLSVPPHIDVCPPRLCTTLDGQLDGPADGDLGLLFDPEVVAAGPPLEGFYCDECWNGQGKCFCYYDLRAEECKSCGKGEEFCGCWPSKRLRTGIIQKLSDPISAREGRITRPRTHFNVRERLGLRIGGVELRGGMDDGMMLLPREKERGRQRQRETDKTARSPLLEKFGSPPKFPSPLRFSVSADSNGDEGYAARDVDHSEKERPSKTVTTLLVPSELRGMQDAWRCVCGKCGGAVVCGLRVL